MISRLALAANVEVLQRALRLRAPQTLGGDLDFTKTVALGAHGLIRVGHGRALSK
jgi:hypothetical protein